MSAVTILSYLTPEKFPDIGFKTMVKCKYLNNRIYAALISIGLVFILLIWSSCGEGPFHPVSETEEEEIKMALKDRSFRQFDPDDIDASPRKGVILDFFDGS